MAAAFRPLQTRPELLRLLEAVHINWFTIAIMNSLRIARAALRARPAAFRAPLQRRGYAEAVNDKASRPENHSGITRRPLKAGTDFAMIALNRSSSAWLFLTRYDDETLPTDARRRWAHATPFGRRGQEMTQRVQEEFKG